MSIQTFDWGFINWIYESKKDGNIPIYIGMSYMKPKAIQGSHIHYGDEQILYILQGNGIQYINGEEYEIKKDTWFRIGMGSSHETVNTGEEDIVKLLISFPIETKLFKEKRFEEQNNIFLPLSEVIEKIDIENKLNFPVTILSDENEVIYSSSQYTNFCNDRCKIKENPLNCMLISKKEGDKSPSYSHLNSYKCKYGISVYNKSIVYNNKLLGYIAFGHTSGSILPESDEKSNIPKSTVSGIITLIDKLIENIIDIYEKELTSTVLKKKDKDIIKYLAQEVKMEKSLNTLENEMLSIKINNHFLFNTLNAIANLSIKGDKLKTYKSIIELSKLLRYSVEKENDLVTVADELSYIKNYIDLQKLRFEKYFTVKYSIEDITLNEKVPFNILQPIVENIFIHSKITSNNDTRIKIDIEKNTGKTILISISDNGKGMEKEKIQKLFQLFEENNKKESGLVMIYKKLLSFYGENFKMDIKTEKDKGTTVLLELPVGVANEKSNNS